ncbi:hypothetical protein [Phorcysia thermohydrogeniphila]|nr:hypothetical protein [Phorcysia thermohydrogeniphila]
MKQLKLPAIYVALTAGSGILLGTEVLVPLALGFSIFIPALCYVVAREYGIAAAAILSIAALGVAVPVSGWKVCFDLSSFPLIGILARFLKGKLSLENFLLILGALLFSVTLLEEQILGLPEEVRQLAGFMNLRWGIYFFSSFILAAISTGVISLLSREDFGFKRLKFGFWVVPIFLVSGFLAVLDLFPEVKQPAANVLIATFSIFTVQGFAVLSSFVERLSLLSKVLLLAAIFLFPIGALIVAMLAGIFDFWFDFRKLKGGERDGGNSH